MIRWLLSPIILVSVGLAAGLVTLQLNMAEGSSDQRTLAMLGAGTAFVACGITFVLLRFERRSITSLRDHPRHMWLVYPFWLLAGLGGFSRSHVSIFYIFPFAALSGVMIGNFITIALRLDGAPNRVR